MLEDRALYKYTILFDGKRMELTVNQLFSKLTKKIAYKEITILVPTDLIACVKEDRDLTLLTPSKLFKNIADVYCMIRIAPLWWTCLVKLLKDLSRGWAG